MAVSKLFWSDPYLAECEAVVTSVAGEQVTLDRTVAFAFSGGQASDVGTIGGWPIIGAEADGFEICYTLPPDHSLEPGSEVTVTIDWPTRYRLMRLHFAAELVLEIVGRRFGRPLKTGANISAEKARIDFAWEGSIADVLPSIQAELEELVSADLRIGSAFSDERAQRRYWEIEGFARVPCGGTHPRRTGEVGRVGLKRTNPGGGRERIEIRLLEPQAS